MIAGGLTSCALAPPPLTWTKTTSIHTEARDEECSFDILTVRPDRAFDELGIIDVQRGGFTEPLKTAGEFRSSAHPYVCAAGGDAVLAEVNGLGIYVRGTVIRYRPVTATDAAQ
ncbi:MAG: hypothetical protein L0Y66_03685 [Myxococcaceae bacterium]|nr:hypothetical protein [Myxococcaceae bacterium]